MHAKYKDDVSNHIEYYLGLWSEAVSTNESDRNQVYSISMNMI